MGEYEITAWILKKVLALLYFNAFLIAKNQNLGLLGENGILPISRYLKKLKFSDTYSLLHFFPSDRMLSALAWSGLGLSTLVILGISDSFGILFSGLVWFLMWVCYLSITNAGQTWYSFGWETLLLESGFLAIFLGPSNVETPAILMFLFRWVSFRVMFGAGLIKLRGDRCWWDLTCLNYHYETQPIPNPLSWYIHHLPTWLHRSCVAVTHFVELVVPFFLLIPGPLGWIAGLITIYFQMTLIISGNLSFLNYLTIAVTIPCLDDRFWMSILPLQQPEVVPMGAAYFIAVGALSLMVAVLSIRPTLNLLAKRQLMNFSYDNLHLVNTYGAFGSITKERYEVIIEGTTDPFPDESAVWQEYEFKAKPGSVGRHPPLVSPYHLRLDWLLWFAAMGPIQYYPWMLKLVERLLQAEPQVLKLIAHDPFQGERPRFIRISWYRYSFTKPGAGSKDWWTRSYVDQYLRPVALDDPVLKALGKRLPVV